MLRSTALFALFSATLSVSVAAYAEPLTIKAGESWVFEVDHGEPVRARRANASIKPRAGQIKATVVSMMGTTMTLTNNSPLNYTFHAELIGTVKPAGKARTCTLPAKGAPALEYWPVKATAVRISAFKVASTDGNCP